MVFVYLDLSAGFPMETLSLVLWTVGYSLARRFEKMMHKGSKSQREFLYALLNLTVGIEIG